MRRLLGQIRAFEALVPHWSVVAPRISRWSVGMHLHHCALTMQGTVAETLRCDSPAPRWRLHLFRALVLVTGRIPRGRAQAPAAVRPPPDIGPDDITDAIHVAAESIGRLRDVRADQWYRHFALGVIRARSIPRFLQVHNRHHLRIIRDVLGG